MLRFPVDDEHLVPAMLQAMAACYPERYTVLGTNVILRAGTSGDRVAVITSGGGGAEPQFAGYAGAGLADAACVGNLRAAPNAYALYEAGRLLGAEHGVLLVYNNFAGDLLNNDMAAELLELDGIAARSVLVTDDIASARGEPRECRGGLSGILQVLRIAAGAARRGHPLDECHRLAEKTNARLASLSVVEDAAAGDIMIGSGFSGEPPLVRSPDRDAILMARTVAGMVAEDLQPEASDQLEIVVNQLSGWTLLECLLFTNLLKEEFVRLGHQVRNARVGGYFNPFCRRGCYVNVLRADEELRGYLNGILYTENFSL